MISLRRTLSLVSLYGLALFAVAFAVDDRWGTAAIALCTAVALAL